MARAPRTATPANLGGSAIGFCSEGDKAHDRLRRETSPWRAWYGTARWRAIRRGQFTHEPLCRMCEADGLVTAATVCDHIAPHRGDPEKFWNGPFQSLCDFHHNRDKQREENNNTRR